MARRSEGGRAAGGPRVVAGGIALRFGDPAGARAERADDPPPKPRPAPPPSGPFPEVIDRIDAIERAGTALVAGRPVLIHGEPGSGKTTLLRHLSRTASHDAPDAAGAWPDGTVLLSARGVEPGDLLQALHRALHHSDAPWHATPRQIDNGLRDRQALVLIDDLAADPPAVATLLARAPGCAFALASESDLEGLDLVRVGISGLDPAAGLELLRRATGREPTPLEAARIREVHRGLAGHPLRLLQAAALLHSSSGDLEAIARLAGEEEPESALAEVLGRELTPSRARALSALEAVSPASLSAAEAAAIAELDDPGADLEALAQRGLARVEGARYRAAGGLGAALAAAAEPETWRRRALDDLAARAAAGEDAGAEASESMLWALGEAVSAERWGDVLAIARSVEAALAREGRWEAWGAALEAALEAATASDDRASEAWALHERGSRALALEETERAVRDLERAVEIREALGDERSAEASRRNLALALGAGAPEGPAPARRRGRSRLAWALLAVALVAIAAIAFLEIRRRSAEPETVDAGTVRFDPTPVGGAGLAPVAVSNAGAFPARVGPAALAGDRAGEFEIVEDGCSGTEIATGERCVMVVAFHPDGVGDRTGRLVVPFEDEPPRAVTLSGLGLPAPEGGAQAGSPGVQVSPTRLDFGSQPVDEPSGPLPVAVANRTGGAERFAVRIEPAGGRTFALADDRCSNVELDPGEACVVEIRFRPAGPGLETATLAVRPLGTSEELRVPLTGTGAGSGPTGEPAADTTTGAPADTAAPADTTGLAVDPVEIDFGEVPAGTRSDPREVVLENHGSAAVPIATVRLAGLDAAVFSIVSDRCSGGLLSAGGRCAIRVAFEPAEAGGWSARLEVRDSTGRGPDLDLEGSGG